MKISGHATPLKQAFTLLEVMIAVGIFFAVSFAILAMVSSGLRTAGALGTTRPDASIVAGGLFVTNKLEEGGDSGDFGKVYPNHEWRWEAYEVETNGLWQVDIEILKRSDRSKPESRLSINLYRPQWQTKGLGVQPP